MTKTVVISLSSHKLLAKLVKKQKEQGERANYGELVDTLIKEKAKLQ